MTGAERVKISQFSTLCGFAPKYLVRLSHHNVWHNIIKVTKPQLKTKKNMKDCPSYNKEDFFIF